jgi:hypothetical protein
LRVSVGRAGRDRLLLGGLCRLVSLIGVLVAVLVGVLGVVVAHGRATS